MDIVEYCLKYFPDDAGGFWEFIRLSFGEEIAHLPEPVLHKYAGFYRKNKRREERRRRYYENLYYQSQPKSVDNAKEIELIDVLENGTHREVSEAFGISESKARRLKHGYKSDWKV